MMFAHQITCAAYHFVIWIAPNEKLSYKSKFYIQFAEIEHELLFALTE